jgi:hypothetical protein
MPGERLRHRHGPPGFKAGFACTPMRAGVRPGDFTTPPARARVKVFAAVIGPKNAQQAFGRLTRGTSQPRDFAAACRNRCRPGKPDRSEKPDRDRPPGKANRCRRAKLIAVNKVWERAAAPYPLQVVEIMTAISGSAGQISVVDS